MPLLLAVSALQAYFVLPPGIPFVTSFGLIPFRMRLSNYAIVGLIAYGLYSFGFSVVESLVIGCLWMLLILYLVLDYMYDIPLTI